MKNLSLAIFATLSLLILSCKVAKTQTTSPVHQMFRPPLGFAGVSGTSADTITNTGTAYDSINLLLAYRTGVIEVQCTKISGTLAGTLKIQAAIANGYATGPSWITLQDTATVTNTSGTKSYFFQLPGTQRLDNAASGSGTVSVWPVPPVLPYYIYRVLWTGSGTMVGSMKSYACLRQ